MAQEMELRTRKKTHQLPRMMTKQQPRMTVAAVVAVVAVAVALTLVSIKELLRVWSLIVQSNLQQQQLL